MDDKKWFLLLDGTITGPHPQADADRRASQNPGYLIWGRGHSDWFPVEKWKKTVSDQEAIAARAKSKADRLWRIRIAGTELNPMGHDQMIEYLKTKNDLSEVKIWTEGYNEWKDIFQIHKVMDELGVSRRKHPRVPIMGQVTAEDPTGNFVVKALSIGEGGLGVTDAQRMKIGDRYKLNLKSPNLYNQINASIEVVYVGNDGYAGLKFTAIHSESKSSIIEYVKKFTDSKPTF